MELAHIALFVYNRPEHTRRTVDALAANEIAAESDLFIFSDGPKKPEAEVAVAEVREYIKSIAGFRSVTVMERQENYGLARSIITGVTELVHRYGRIIVLEDDLVVSPFFLKYLNEALELYENDEQVMQISGHMFDLSLNVDTDAIFLSFVTTWGWATWSRAWKYFDASMSGYSYLRDNSSLRKKFNLDGNYKYFDLLDRKISGAVDSWGIVWNLSVFMQKGVVLYPVKTLVINCGFDASGTHCKTVLKTSLRCLNTKRDFRFPTTIAESNANKQVYKAIYKANNPSALAKLKHFLRIAIGNLKRFGSRSIK